MFSVSNKASGKTGLKLRLLNPHIPFAVRLRVSSQCSGVSPSIPAGPRRFIARTDIHVPSKL